MTQILQCGHQSLIKCQSFARTRIEKILEKTEKDFRNNLMYLLMKIWDALGLIRTALQYLINTICQPCTVMSEDSRYEIDLQNYMY